MEWDDVDNLVKNIWNKKRIFCKLEYYIHNMFLSNIDTMHMKRMCLTIYFGHYLILFDKGTII